MESGLHGRLSAAGPATERGENGEGNTDGDSSNAESSGSLTVLPKSWGSSITYNP